MRRLRSYHPRATVTGGVGTVLSGIWAAYSAFNTASDLPTDASKAARMLADPPIYLPYLILAACIVVLAWSLWPRPEGPEADHGASVTISPVSHGPQSPSIGVNHGPITIGATPAPVQERKQAVSHRPSRTIPNASSHRPRATPDLPLAGVLARIYRKHGGVPEGEARKTDFIRKVNREIMDTVFHERLHVWARFGERVLELIEHDYWKDGTLDHRRNEWRVQAAYSSDLIYTDLHFNKAEVDRIWPMPPRTTNDGRP